MANIYRPQANKNGLKNKKKASYDLEKQKNK